MISKNPQLQFESPELIRVFQEDALCKQLSYLSRKSVFYRELFKTSNVNPDKVRTLEDLKHIPLTSKKDLQERNADFICAPKHEIMDYVTTSGTLGEPVTFALTKSDIARLAYNESLSFGVTGCTKGDVLQLMTTIDRMFMAGLAYYLGAQECGMGVARVGNGIPQLQWNTMASVKPSVAVCVPSFLLKLIEYAEETGIDHHNSTLSKAICIGEALRTADFIPNTLGAHIAEKWPKLQLFSTYASTEMQSSFTECECGKGGHLQPELIITELLDEHGNEVSEGEMGELTITTLGVEGMPLLRFRTGDICRFHTEPCACGRNTIRLSPIVGRKGQMIKYKGTTLYPPALYDVLDKIEGVKNYIVEVYTNDIGTDEILIRVGSDVKSDEFAKLIKDVFRSKVRVAPSIVFEKPEYIAQIQQPAHSRKAAKFFDRRANS